MKKFFSWMFRWNSLPHKSITHQVEEPVDVKRINEYYVYCGPKCYCISASTPEEAIRKIRLGYYEFDHMIAIYKRRIQ